MDNRIFISSDGVMGFRGENYLQHEAGDPNMMRSFYEITLWTCNYPNGRIYKWTTKEERDKVLQELKQFLNQ